MHQTKSISLNFNFYVWKMRIIIFRIILWTEWHNGYEQTVHTVGKKQVVTMTKWLSPKDDSKPILTQEFQSHIIATHTLNSGWTKLNLRCIVPIAIMLKAFIWTYTTLKCKWIRTSFFPTTHPFVLNIRGGSSQDGEVDKHCACLLLKPH